MEDFLALAGILVLVTATLSW